MESTKRDDLVDSINRLGPWFHNFHLKEGVETAPRHFLGDFPSCKWKEIDSLIPRDLTGWRCLDIGCNAGFYSFELARRGGQVLGIDSDPAYLRQADWISVQLALDRPPEFRQLQIHDLARLNAEFDLVLFMGVFYHLRYPSLALDTVASKVRKLMVFQTLTTHDSEVVRPAPDYDIAEREILDRPGWPKVSFVERKFSHDWTNWFVPNHAACEALLRSTGFEKIERVAHEIYFCTPPQGGVRARRAWPDDEWKSATGVSQ